MRRVSLILIIIFFTLESCRPPLQEEATSRISVILANDPINLNPVLSEDAYSSQVCSRIFESLIERNPETLQFEPKLAESFSVSSNNLVFTFKLRKNVQFHNGMALTSRDVLYSYMKIMDPKIPNPHRKVYYQDVASISAPDNYTIIFNMKKRYFKSIENLGGFEIIPEKVYSQGDFVSHERNQHGPIGTGPYTFQEWKTGQRVVLKRNEKYWGKKPAITAIHYKIIKNETVALQALKKRSLDLMNLRPLPWTKQTQSEKFNTYFQKLKYMGSGYRYVGYNTKVFPFNHVKVRKAMAHLMNLEKIKEGVEKNLVEITTGPFHMSGLQYDKSVQPLRFNPEKAMNLLKEAGFTDSDSDGYLDLKGKKFSFELLIPASAGFYEQFSSIIKDDFLKAGIALEIRKLEFQILVERANKRDFQALVMGWSTPIESDPYQIWHSSQLAKGHNFTGFATPETDSLIERARVEFNEKKRNAMYNKLHSILAENQPYTFLFSPYSLVAVNRRFENVQVYPLGLDMDRWTIGKFME